MVDYIMQNYVGDGERPIINVPPFNKERYLTSSELEPFLAADRAELASLEEKGISLEDLCDFMDHLLNGGSKLNTNELVDGLFRVFDNRSKLNRIRDKPTIYGTSRCPVMSCGKKIGHGKDVFFNPSEYPYAEGKNELGHPCLRLNDISIHLARHGIFQKGDAMWDQCYPTSPLKFANEFYIPWKECKGID